MFCKKCGKQIRNDSNVCSYCGALQKNAKKSNVLMISLCALIGVLLLVILVGLFLILGNGTNGSEDAYAIEEDESSDQDEQSETETEEDNNIDITGQKSPKEEEERIEEYSSEDTGEQESIISVNGNTQTQVYSNRIMMSKEEVKAEEARIREQVNSGSATNRVDYAAGQDGCPWKRRYEFENGKLIFAFYSNATNGALDQRYYFKDDCLIEWIPYTGNGAPDSSRHFVSDTPLASGWYDEQDRVLHEAYGESEQDVSASEAGAKKLVNEMEGYEYYVIINDFRITDGRDTNELTISFDARQRAIAAGMAKGCSDEYSEPVIIEEFVEYCYIDEDQLITSGKNLFGKTVSVNDLAEYDDNWVDSDVRKLNGVPVYLYITSETDTSYEVKQVNVYTDNNKYQVVKKVYCGHWSGNDSRSDYQIEYTLVPNNVSKYGVVIESMKIKLNEDSN